MIKWIGQHIWDFTSRFRSDVYLESISSTTETDMLVVAADGKISKRAIDAITVDVSDFMTNGADNYVLTATGTDAMNAEANLQFNGTTLALAGLQTITSTTADQFTVKYDANNYFKIDVPSNGDTELHTYNNSGSGRLKFLSKLGQFQFYDSDNVSDYAQFSIDSNGGLSVSTTDAAGSDANITFVADGYADFSRTQVRLSGGAVGADAVGAAGDGIMLHLDDATLEETNTSAEGTATMTSMVHLGQPTMDATNADVTITDAATLYIKNAPASGGSNNPTLTNALSLWVGAGRTKLEGQLDVGKASSGVDAKFYGDSSDGAVLHWDHDYQTYGGLIGGVDGQGVDLKFFGDTTGKYVEWDQSNDRLALAGSLYAGTGTDILPIVASDVTIYDDNNNADTLLAIGTGNAEAVLIQCLNGASNKTAETIKFTSKTASSTANHGRFLFSVDQTNIFEIHDTGTTVQGGNNEELDYNGTTFENTLSDGEYQGGKILKYSPGADDTLTVGGLYFLNSDGTWDVTDADGTDGGAMNLLGVGFGSARTAGVLLEGFIRIPSTEILNTPGSGAVDGLHLYVSTTAGHFDFTAPSGNNDFVRIVGYAIDDDSSDVLIYFNPDKTWVKVSA